MSDRIIPVSSSPVTSTDLLSQIPKDAFGIRHPLNTSSVRESEGKFSQPILNQYYQRKKSVRIIEADFSRVSATEYFPDLDLLSHPRRVIYGVRGAGVSYELKRIGDLALRRGVYAPVYCDLLALEMGLIDSVGETIENRFFEYGSLESNIVFSRGKALLLFDNFHRVSPAVATMAVRFIESLNHYGNGNVYIIGANREIDYLPEYWVQSELAPWSGEQIEHYLNLRIYPKYIRDRISALRYTPEWVANLDNYHRILLEPVDNLALVYANYLPRLLERIKDFLPLTTKAVSNLLIGIADIREYELEYDLSEWSAELESVLEIQQSLIRQSNLNKFNADDVLSALLQAGIMTHIDSRRIRFADLNLHYFLLAQSYVDRSMLAMHFDREFLTDSKWLPILLFYVELHPREKIAETARALMQTIKGYELENFWGVYFDYLEEMALHFDRFSVQH